MEIVHLSEFYSCSSIDLSCELFYVCELGKYLKYYYNRILSLKGIQLDKILKKSDLWFYFCLALKEEWLCDVDLPEYWLIELDTLTPKDWKNKTLILKNVLYTTQDVSVDYTDLSKRKEDYAYDLRVPRICQIGFSKYENGFYYFDMNSEDISLATMNTTSINSTLPQLSWVSLVAYCAVLRYADLVNNVEYPFKLALVFGDTSIIYERSLSYILILLDKGKCFKKDWLVYTFSDKVQETQRQHIGYISWYVEGEEKGLLAKQEWYSPISKQQKLKELGIIKGSVMFLFERQNLQRFNYIKSIIDCKIVIIENISKKGVTVTICNNTELKTTSIYNFNTYPKVVKDMYKESKPYDKPSITRKLFSWDSIGVEYFTTTELFMLVPLEQCCDFKDAFVDNGNLCVEVVLNQYDYIYWLLEEYEIHYDSLRFKETYFQDMIPLYELFMINKQPIPVKYLKVR